MFPFLSPGRRRRKGIVTGAGPVALMMLIILGGSGCAERSGPDSTGGQVGEVGEPAGTAPGPEPTKAAPGVWREFRNQQGQSIRARMVDLVGDRLSIEREDGRVFTSPIQLYSEADQLHVKRIKLEGVIAAQRSNMRISDANRKHVTKRDVIEIALKSKESVRDFYKAHIDRHGSLVGCRTLFVGQDTRDHYAATLKEIEDLRSVLSFGTILNAPLDG